MPAALRVLDPTNHGSIVLGPGMSTVLIGGQPAAVAGDQHVCPAHGPSPIPSAFTQGSSSVSFGGRPALRSTDPSSCGAMGAVGFPTVLIGG